MKLRFLGTGAAGGTPLYGCRCPACMRALTLGEHRRQPACVSIETGDSTLLLDAGLPELGHEFPCGSFDAILLTHFHMDHVQGLFQMRWGRDCRLPVIGPDDPTGCDDLLKHPGILDFGYKAIAFEPFILAGMHITPLPLNHSRPTLGYAVAHDDVRLAYLTDTLGLPEETTEWLCQSAPDLLVLDCSYPPLPQRPRNHNDLRTALHTIEALGAGRSMLTHIGHELEQWLMEGGWSRLPDNVAVASDRFTVEV